MSIVLCMNTLCPLSVKCLRHIKKPEPKQSRALFKFRRVGGRVACNDFISSNIKTNKG